MFSQFQKTQQRRFTMRQTKTNSEKHRTGTERIFRTFFFQIQILKWDETRKLTEKKFEYEHGYLVANAGACRIQFLEVFQVASPQVNDIAEKNVSKIWNNKQRRPAMTKRKTNQTGEKGHAGLETFNILEKQLYGASENYQGTERSFRRRVIKPSSKRTEALVLFSFGKCSIFAGVQKNCSADRNAFTDSKNQEGKSSNGKYTKKSLTEESDIGLEVFIVPQNLYQLNATR